MNPVLNEIIFNIDKKIKSEELYKSKAYHQSNFNFQLKNNKVEPYHVKSLQSIAKEEIKQHSLKAIVMEDMFADSIKSKFFNEGVVARLNLLTEEGYIVAIRFFKNISPEIFYVKIRLDDSNFLKELKKSKCHVTSILFAEELPAYITIELNSDFNKKDEFLINNQHAKLKKNGNEINFLSEEIKNEIEWETLFNYLKEIVKSSDDDCPSIFNRMDYLYWMHHHKEEINELISSLSTAQKNEFESFFTLNKSKLDNINNKLNLSENEYYAKQLKNIYSDEIINDFALNVSNQINYIHLHSFLEEKTITTKPKI